MTNLSALVTPLNSHLQPTLPSVDDGCSSSTMLPGSHISRLCAAEYPKIRIAGEMTPAGVDAGCCRGRIP